MRKAKQANEIIFSVEQKKQAKIKETEVLGIQTSTHTSRTYMEKTEYRRFIC